MNSKKFAWASIGVSVIFGVIGVIVDMTRKVRISEKEQDAIADKVVKKLETAE